MISTRRPLPGAGISMLALSASMEYSASPSESRSPGCLSHSVILARCMFMPIRGILSVTFMPPLRLGRGNRESGLDNTLGCRQQGCFRVRRVGQRDIWNGDAADRRLQGTEGEFRDHRGNLAGGAAPLAGLVHDDESPCLRYRTQHGLPIQWNQAANVYDLS